MSPKQNPTGLTGAAVTVLLGVGQRLGLGLTVEEALAIVGLTVAAVSYFTPREPVS